MADVVNQELQSMLLEIVRTFSKDNLEYIILQLERIEGIVALASSDNSLRTI